MSGDHESTNCEVIVVGGGPVGLTAAIALAAAGVETVLVARKQTAPDHRTSALLAGSVTALETLGVWARCIEHAAPLRVMRIVDDTARLMRAPEVRFAAAEIDLDAFGHNIEHRRLVAALEQRATELSAARIDAQAQAVETGQQGVTVRLDGGGTVMARLVVGADGRRSLCRAAAGIESDGRRYPQTALVCNVAHGRPHEDISTEFHTESGPFTLVPLPGKRSSVVWVVDPTQAKRLASLDDAILAAEIERRSHSILGKLDLEPGRGFFSLTIETARKFAANRIALVGEAAHVIPPIGAQGLNLGLRDAATIGELVVEARRTDADIASVLARYDELRRADVGSRTFAVDMLNQSLLSDFLPVQGLRGLGLYLIDRVGPLRRAVLREGVAPAAQPRLMRGEALSPASARDRAAAPRS
jgi:2-octaprenyl-6-methoxyphenol hydroxylase